ncbi:recombinase family protein [Enterococcus faecalis]
MRIGTQQQKFDSQQNALDHYEVDYTYKEKGSGRNTTRTELNKALKRLKPGDTFVIFKLDRLAYGTKQLLNLLERFEKDTIQFVSIQNNIDPSTAMGRFFFTATGAFAGMEAELIRKRVMARLAAARENGKQLGCPPRKKARKLLIYTSIPHYR